jgi:hypothetical protein
MCFGCSGEIGYSRSGRTVQPYVLNRRVIDFGVRSINICPAANERRENCSL